MAKVILVEVLKKKKISKRAFGRMIGAREDNVWRIFRPGYNPKFSTLQAWAKALKIKVRDLIKE